METREFTVKVRYKGKPLTLKLTEEVEEVKVFDWIEGTNYPSKIHCIKGHIVKGWPGTLEQGDLFFIDSPEIRARFHIMSAKGRIRTEGAYSRKESISA